MRTRAGTGTPQSGSEPVLLATTVPCRERGALSVHGPRHPDECRLVWELSPTSAPSTTLPLMAGQKHQRSRRLPHPSAERETWRLPPVPTNTWDFMKRNLYCQWQPALSQGLHLHNPEITPLNFTPSCLIFLPIPGPAAEVLFLNDLQE